MVHGSNAVLRPGLALTAMTRPGSKAVVRSVMVLIAMTSNGSHVTDGSSLEIRGEYGQVPAVSVGIPMQGTGTLWQHSHVSHGPGMLRRVTHGQ